MILKSRGFFVVLSRTGRSVVSSANNPAVPGRKNQPVNFFNFVNQLYEDSSFIITTTKLPLTGLNDSLTTLNSIIIV
jgi:hypothetical protein